MIVKEANVSKKVIVTGGGGFIGSAVVKELLSRAYEVRIIDDLSKPESALCDECEFLKIDLTDQEKTNKAFNGFQYCINLAAKIGGIGYFHKYPATILSENNKIYSSTFEAAVKNDFKRMIYISSSMVFESTKQFPSKEDDLPATPLPISAYGFSKLVGEFYCSSFLQEYGLAYTIIRPFNAYGINEAPGEEVGYAHAIPDLAKKILMRQNPLEILGDGQQIRCFTHVSDIAEAIVIALESDNAVNEDFNISSARETKIVDLARLIFDICDTGETLDVKFVEGFEHDVKRRVPDVTKAKKYLRWEAKIKLEDGLPEVIGWIREKYHE